MTENEDSVGALIIGVISLFLWILPIIGFPLSIIGLVLSIKGVKSDRKYSTAALICCIIGIILVVGNAAIGAYMGATGQLGL